MNYLETELGSAGELVFKKLGWERASLLQNPFFLVNTCEFCKKHGNKLPEPLGNLFEYLIEASLDARIKSISHIGKGNKDALRRTCKASLEELAFLMETQKLNEVSKGKFFEIVKDEQRQAVLLEGSSLITLSGELWCFTHRIFQEYLAAKGLKKAKDFNVIREAIAYKPDFNHLKWSNVSASFLLSLLEDNPVQKTALIDWLAKANPEVLIAIGSFDNVSVAKSDRERIFKAVFESCKKEGLVVALTTTATGIWQHLVKVPKLSATLWRNSEQPKRLS